jgi:Predicted nucleic acid-binding protein, contains PIN domain
MIFVDSGIWIAGKNQRDQYHKKACLLLSKIKNEKYGKSIISDYIIDEVLTFLNRKAGHKIALETLQFFELRETMI